MRNANIFSRIVHSPFLFLITVTICALVHKLQRAWLTTRTAFCNSHCTSHTLCVQCSMHHGSTRWLATLLSTAVCMHLNFPFICVQHNYIECNKNTLYFLTYIAYNKRYYKFRDTRNGYRRKNYPNKNGVIYTSHTFLSAIPISLNFDHVAINVLHMSLVSLLSLVGWSVARPWVKCVMTSSFTMRKNTIIWWKVLILDNLSW